MRRVLLDSNVWLAILTTDGFCRRGWRLARPTCKFCASQDILHEVEEKLRTKFGFSARHARLMTLFVTTQTEMVQATSAINICRGLRDPLPAFDRDVHERTRFLHILWCGLNDIPYLV